MAMCLKQLLTCDRTDEISRLSEYSSSPDPFSYLSWKVSYAKVKRATSNFSSPHLVGDVGETLDVYKGTLPNGLKVAVKRYKNGRGNCLAEFQAEVNALSKIRHRNIVSMIGHCTGESSDRLILVCEYMEKGSLRDHLYASDGRSPSEVKMSWERRLKICVQTAEALWYLHSGRRFVHRDVKPSNILLDENYMAKLANFSLSRAVPSDGEDIVGVAGSSGYIDPEYFRTSHLTEKSDIYSFGVVLLEVLCGRPSIIVPSTDRKEEENLAEWGILCQEKGQLYKIIDPALVGSVCASSLVNFVQTAQMCLRLNSHERPDARDILRNLNSALKLQDTAASENSLDWAPFETTRRQLKISYAEIMQAVKNFSQELIINEGGFGTVYKGFLSNGVEVTVKRYDHGRSQGRLGDFRAQVMLSSLVRHPNIISLLGYCDEGSEMILVHEYVENRNLGEHLNLIDIHSAKSWPGPNLTWRQRLQICVGSAEVLHYLHSGCERKIIHGDVTPFNIFLDENSLAKVALYGPFDVHKECATRLRGTYGYVDPEYFRTTDYTEECDVYAFGVLLIEVLCARRCPELIKYRLEWRSGKVENIIDPVLVGTICPASLKLYCEVAENCLRHRPERPGMREVLWNLDYALQLQQTTAEREWHDKYSVFRACSELLLKAIQSYASHILVEV